MADAAALKKWLEQRLREAGTPPVTELTTLSTGPLGKADPESASRPPPAADGRVRPQPRPTQSPGANLREMVVGMTARGDGSRTGSATLRRAVLDDLPRIVALLADDPIGRSRENPGTQLDTRYRDAFAAIERDPNHLLAVADRGGHLIGVLQLSFIPGLSLRGMWRGQIEGVRVASGERTRGVGREMLEWAIEECRRRGCGLVQLTSDKRRIDAHRFYERLGFEATHQGYKLAL